MIFANRRWMEFVFGVVVPTALTALAAAAVVYLAMGRMATEVNAIDRDGVTRVIEVIKDETLGEMGRAASEFAASPAAAAVLGRGIDDPSVEADLRRPTESGRFFDTLLVLDAEGTPLRAFHGGRPAARCRSTAATPSAISPPSSPPWSGPAIR